MRDSIALDVEEVIREFYSRDIVMMKYWGRIPDNISRDMAQEIVVLRRKVADLGLRLSWADSDPRHEMGS